jgi:hypothetical protein
MGGLVLCRNKTMQLGGGGGLSSCLLFFACFCSHSPPSSPFPFSFPAMPGLNKGFASKPSQKKKGELTPERRSRKSPHRKRSGVTPEQLRHALTGVFMGFDGGKLWSINSAANRADGVTRGPLQWATEESVCVLLRKGGFEGHAKPPPSGFFVNMWKAFSIFAGPSYSALTSFSSFLPSFFILLHS